MQKIRDFLKKNWPWIVLAIGLLGYQAYSGSDGLLPMKNAYQECKDASDNDVILRLCTEALAGELSDQQRNFVSFRRAAAYQDKKEYGKAATDYEAALQADPHDSLAYAQRGVTYAERGEDGKAIADFTKAIEEAPLDTYRKYVTTVMDFAAQNAQFYASRGVVYERMGKRTEAIEDFRKALELNPSHARAHERLTKLDARPPALQEREYLLGYSFPEPSVPE
jgi:tetratricopeptide (TPR) repeat protein